MIVLHHDRRSGGDTHYGQAKLMKAPRPWNRLSQATARITIGCMIASTMPAVAQTGGLTCSSNDGGYHYCRADTQGQVALTRQISGSPCQQGYSWGYDYRGIWVDRGCRAQFTYGRYNNGGNGGGDNTGAAIAAGILGAIVIGSIVAAQNNDNGNHDDQRRDAYRDGYRNGQRDWDDDLDPYYARYRNRYPSQYQGDFAAGYDDGYNNRPNRYR
jgi:hypothetical protein